MNFSPLGYPRVSNSTPLLNTVPGMSPSTNGPLAELHPPPALPWMINGVTLYSSYQHQNSHNHVGGSNSTIQPSVTTITESDHTTHLTIELENLKKKLSQVTNEMT